jgi:hypothetical protein
MAKPTHAQIHAVRQALYSHKHVSRLKFLRQQIGLLMNLNHDHQLGEHDIRNPPGSGPNWIIRDTGSIDPLVTQAADLCDQVAKTMLAIRSDVQKVSFPAGDKRALLKAIHEEAASWTARGRAWRAPPSGNVQAAVNDINQHVQAGLQASRHLQHYFKDNLEVFG